MSVLQLQFRVELAQRLWEPRVWHQSQAELCKEAMWKQVMKAGEGLERQSTGRDSTHRGNSECSDIKAGSSTDK